MAAKRILHVYDTGNGPFAELLDADTMIGTGRYIASIGLVILKAREEMNATKLAGTDPIRMAQEAANESLRALWICDAEGKNVQRVDVSTQDGSAESYTAKMHPKLRELLLGAYAEIHKPSSSEVKDFFTSKRLVAD